MKLLALDTASGQCSVALVAGDQLITRSVSTAREHAQLLLPMVDAVLAESGLILRGLDGIAFGCGPGSFTGLRIAASVTQGLAAGADLSVLPISDLRALAEDARFVLAHEGAPATGWLLACMDARMGELYWGLFENGAAPVGAALDNERLSAPATLLEEVPHLLRGSNLVGGAGMGLAAYPSLALELGLAASRCFPHAEPHAAAIARLALADLAAGAVWQDPAAAQPVYLRNRVVQGPL
jgi:tRNA threonylcarbamoyladenosine biosynthesis protein TsaB